jgi:hypothetical protein
MGFKADLHYSEDPKPGLVKVVCTQCGAIGYTRPLGYNANHKGDFHIYCNDDCRLKVTAHRKRAKKFNNGPIEFIGPEIVYKKAGYVCGICNKPVDPSLDYPDPESPSLDHIMPLSLGGTHTWDNVQLAHLRCNVKKNNNIA